MDTGPLKLFWKTKMVGVVTDATFSDFPWKAGRFEARKMSERLREVLDWFAAQAVADELLDPPFAVDLLEEWVIVDANGVRHELFLPPLIDFAKGIVEWR